LDLISQVVFNNSKIFHVEFCTRLMTLR